MKIQQDGSIRSNFYVPSRKPLPRSSLDTIIILTV